MLHPDFVIVFQCEHCGKHHANACALMRYAALSLFLLTMNDAMRYRRGAPPLRIPPMI